MAVLDSTKSCGVTATAHWKDESFIESDLLLKMNFTVHDLFPNVKYPEALDFTKKNYYDLRDLLIQKSYEDHARLIIEKWEAISALAKEDFWNFISIEDDQGKVNDVLD